MSPLFPTLANLLSIVLTIGLTFVLGVIGAAAGGRNRKPEMDLLTGWGVSCFFYSIAGIFTSVSFIVLDVLFIVFFLGALTYVLQQKIDLQLQETIPLLLLALPLMIVASSIMPNMWDEVAHWLPNALYLINNQHFPGAGQPVSISAHADYPYGLPLIIYAVEMTARSFGTTIGQSGIIPIFNLLLLITAARMIITLARAERSSEKKPISLWLGYILALLSVTIACPAFVPHLVLSAYPESSTAVVLMAIGLMLLDTSSRSLSHYLQCVVLLVLAFCIREDNGLVALLLVGAAGLWQWHKGEKFLPIVTRTIFISLPMLVLALLWHRYTAAYVPGDINTQMKTFSQWNTDLLGGIMNVYLSTALHKGGFSLLMLLILGFAVYQWFSKSISHERSGTLAFMTSVAFLGYNLFLVLVYVSMFTPYLAGQAASLWRYNTHFGLLQMAIVVMILARSMPSFSVPKPVIVATALAIGIAPIAFASTLRTDLTPFISATRTIGQDINTVAPGTEKLVFVDLENNRRDGLDCVLIRFQLRNPERLAGCINTLSTPDSITQLLANNPYILVDGWPDRLSSVTNLALSDKQTHLLLHSGGGWKEIQSWPKIPEGK